MNYADEFYVVDDIGENRDIRDQGDGYRIYVHGVPTSAADDDARVPRRQRVRSILGTTLETARTDIVNPAIFRRFSQRDNAVAAEDFERFNDTDLRPVNNDRAWPRVIQIAEVNTGVLRRFAFKLSITNFNDLFDDVTRLSNFLLASLEMELRANNSETNQYSAEFLNRIMGGVAVSRQAAHRFQIQLDWVCRSTNPWTYAKANDVAEGLPAGVIRVTSGAFRNLTVRGDFEEAIRAMYNQLAEYYDFGADIPDQYGEEARAVIQINRNNDGVPVSLSVRNDPGINEFQFVCNLTVVFVAPADAVGSDWYGQRQVQFLPYLGPPAPPPPAAPTAPAARATAPRGQPAFLGALRQLSNQDRVAAASASAGRGRGAGRGAGPATPPAQGRGRAIPAFMKALGAMRRAGCYKKPETEEESRLDLFLTKKQSVIMIRNVDNACFSRALAVILSKAFYIAVFSQAPSDANCTAKPGSVRLSAATIDILREVFLLCGETVCRQYAHLGDMYQQVAAGHRVQTSLAEALCVYCGHDFTLAVDPEAVERFSDRLQLTIRIIDAQSKFKKLAEVGQYESVCYLLKNADHFHALRSVRGLLSKDYECLDCDVVFNKVDGHKLCPYRCFYCHARPCPGDSQYGEPKSRKRKPVIRCDDCNREFLNDSCFEEHKKRTCARFMTCGKRNCKPFKRGAYADLSEHRCGDTVCKNCKKMSQPGRHRCFFKAKAPKPRVEKLLFFDFECSQETGVHVVTHVVARIRDDLEDIVFRPAEDGTFYEVLNQFCDFLFKPIFDGFTCIAHNGQGYDFQFILKWALDNNKVPTNVVRTGQKLKHMVIEGVRFIDSLSFLLMPLASFPKTFGFEEKAKGYFPHMFNTLENQLYVGPMPDKEYYVPDEMSVHGKEAFEKWYGEHAGDHFIFQEEILKYCISDVDILQTGCLKFQQLFYDITGVDPLAYMTIAGACLAVYRGFFNGGDTIMAMNPEDAKFVRRGFFGGRTCVMQAHVKANEEAGECIKYVDVTSLYPWVNTFCEYPLGDYERSDFSKQPATDEFEIETFLETVFGFLEVDLECPPGLLLPVVPEKKDLGLKFDLLPKTKIVVSSIELKKAISLGYRVTKLYGYIHWPETTRTLFKDYMMTFLKVKQEASGWKGKMLLGKQVETDQEKQDWILQYEREEGVKLDISKVEFNPGLRAIAKLCLNSLWGKMGQRPENRQVEYTSEGKKVLDLLRRYKVHEIIDVGDADMHEVVYSTEAAESEASFNTCVALAAITTAHARLRLYSGLETVGSRAIYCDTDSIVYLSKPGEADIPIGDKLGEWTDELGGDYIREFVAAGPKSYAYITRSGKSAVKSKGFKMSYINCQSTLNFENYRAAVDGEEFTMETVTSFKINRDKTRKELVTEEGAVKYFTPTLNRKGVVDAESDTLRVYPFGYDTSL